MAGPSSHVSVSGSGVDHPAGARTGERVAPADTLEVTVVLRPGRDLEPKGRGVWTRDEASAALAPDPDDVARVRRFGKRFGLEVVEVSRLRHDVVLRGPVEAVERAFGVEQRRYRHGGSTYRGHDGDAHLPAELATGAIAVLGLDDRTLHRSGMADAAPAPGEPISFDDLARHYDVPAVDASGLRIGLLEFGGGFHASDVEAALGSERAAGVSVVGVRAGDGRVGSNRPLAMAELARVVTAWRAGEASSLTPEEREAFIDTVEVTMDTEIASSLSGGAAVEVYMVPSGADSWRRGVYAALGAPVGGGDGSELRDPLTALSVSWGASERTFTPIERRAIDRAFRTAAILGVQVFCSSGDHGSADTPEPKGPANVHFPASSPWVTAVGGTELVREGGRIARERTWNAAPVPMASGGGMSGFFPLPPWQESIRIATPRGTWIEGGARSFQGRWLPDVAACASYGSPIDIVVGGQRFFGSGTSAATPVWAGLYTALTAAAGRRLPRLNPVIYASADAAGCFHDVTEGNNDVSGGRILAYSAGPGWDACTGHGSPAGRLLLELLTGAG